MIENLQLQIYKICFILNKSLNLYSKFVQFSYYSPQIIKSGIKEFIGDKYYIDTSCIDGINNINNWSIITYTNRQSRANMQPLENTVWFAKMKDSIKKVIITKYDQDFINKYILSTGFLGIQASNNLPLSFLSSIIISKDFDQQKNSNCVGTTMSSINNETFLNIYVPLLNKDELSIYDKQYHQYIHLLSLYRRK